MAAGIIVVAVSLLLHMNISTGTLNGLILYANLVNISKDQYFPPQKVKVNLLTVFSYIVDELGLWNPSMFLPWTRCILLCMASICFPILPVDIDNTDNNL